MRQGVSKLAHDIEKVGASAWGRAFRAYHSATYACLRHERCAQATAVAPLTARPERALELWRGRVAYAPGLPAPQCALAALLLCAGCTFPAHLSPVPWPPTDLDRPGSHWMYPTGWVSVCRAWPSAEHARATRPAGCCLGCTRTSGARARRPWPPSTGHARCAARPAARARKGGHRCGRGARQHPRLVYPPTGRALLHYRKLTRERESVHRA